MSAICQQVLAPSRVKPCCYCDPAAVLGSPDALISSPSQRLPPAGQSETTSLSFGSEGDAKGQADFCRVEMPSYVGPTIHVCRYPVEEPRPVLEEMAGPPTHEKPPRGRPRAAGAYGGGGCRDVGEDRFRPRSASDRGMSTARVSKWDQLGAAPTLPAGPVARPVMGTSPSHPSRSITRLLRRTGRTNHRGVGDGVPRSSPSASRRHGRGR